MIDDHNQTDNSPDDLPMDSPPEDTLRPDEALVPFEDLTLAEALRYLILRPVETGRQWWAVLARDRASAGEAESPVTVQRVIAARATVPRPVEWDRADEAAEPGEAAERGEVRTLARADVWPLVAWGAALLLAMRGGIVLRRAALDPLMRAQKDTGGALAWFALAVLVALAAEVWVARGGQIAAWWARRRDAQDEDAPEGAPEGAVSSAPPPDDDGAVVVRSRVRTARQSSSAEAAIWRWLRVRIGQLVLVPFALMASGLTYALNVQTDALGKVSDVVLTGGGAIAWALSVILWLLVLGDARRVPALLAEWRGRFAGGRVTWVLPALAAITAVAAVIRLHDLSAAPPEMTSDHIEKLLDALRVNDGYYAVFFANNGGREGFQMYLVALVAKLPGVGFSFEALKLATVIEGVITIPALWWMARQVFGTASAQDRDTGTWVGLVLAGLVTISSWHLMLSRLGLRIVLTPLTAALVIGCLARVMRRGRMRDFLALGLMLGIGVYFYQANRMLPLVAVAGAALAVLAAVRSPRELGRIAGQVIVLAVAAGLPLLAYRLLAGALDGASSAEDNLGARLKDVLPLVAMVWLAVLALAARDRQTDVMRLGGGMLAAAVIALALYIPMYHYSVVQPDQFWNRTRGRMFGDQAFVRTDPASGQLVTYEPSLGEQVERFWDERGVFVDNFRDALLMAHWEGDAAWISNPGGYPALDGPAGGLLALGTVLWLVRVVRRRDPVFALIPAAGLIMLLPSAMTLAYTIENPSFTRASGVIPVVFLMAALPLGVLAARLAGRGLTVRGRRIALGGVVAGLLVTGVLWGSARADWDTFFTDYRLQYTYSWKPYHAIAQPMRQFVEGEGSYGNAFMVAYPHWLDHRILGTVAGDIRWPNGLVTRDDLYSQMQLNTGTAYAYDPTQPLFVMFHAADTETADWLRAQFPDGEMDLYTYQYETQYGVQTGEFTIFRVQAGALG